MHINLLTYLTELDASHNQLEGEVGAAARAAGRAPATSGCSLFVFTLPHGEPALLLALANGPRTVIFACMPCTAAQALTTLTRRPPYSPLRPFA